MPKHAEDFPVNPPEKAVGHDPTKPVGYKNPPRNTQYKEGQSGNPAGRPKVDRSCYGLMKEDLDRKCLIEENGKWIWVTDLEALAKSTVDAGIRGKAVPEDLLLKYAKPDDTPMGGGWEIVNVKREEDIPADAADRLFPSERPQHTRSQTSQPRSPKGRRNGQMKFGELINEELDKPISVEEDGKTITMTKRQFWMRRILNDAKKGNRRALRLFDKIYKPDQPPPGYVRRFYFVDG